MKQLFLSLMVLGVLLGQGSAGAIEGDEQEIPAEATESIQRSEQDELNQQLVAQPVSIHEQLESSFAEIESKLSTSEFAKAAQMLDVFSTTAQEAKYRDLSGYAFRLFDYASRLPLGLSKRDSAFLVRKGVELSPEDIRVVFAASLMYNIVGAGQAWEYFSRSAALLPANPSFVTSALANIAIMLLVSMLLALFFLCLVQFCCYANSLLRHIARRFLPVARGLAGLPILLAILVLPLAGGLALTLAVWSIVLSFYRKSCRSLALVTGLTILCWGLFLPVLETLTLQFSGGFIEVFERINQGAFSSRDNEKLEHALASPSENPLTEYAYGVLQIKERKFDAAVEHFTKSSEIASAGEYPEAERASLLNLATAHYAAGRYPEAKLVLEFLEKKNPEDFAALFNLAQLHLALLDTAGYKNYYAKVSSVDEARGKALVAQLSEETDPLKRFIHLDIPLSSLYARAIESPEDISEGQIHRRRLLRGAVQQDLLRADSANSLIVLGLFTVLIGFMIVKRRIYHVLPWGEGTFRESRVWAILPAGSYLVSKQPLRGVLLLVVFFSLIILFLQEPNIFLSTLPNAKFPRVPFLVLAVLVVIVGMFIAPSAKTERAKTVK